jgi:hypothetical protein
MTGRRVWSYTDRDHDELSLDRVGSGPDGPGIRVKIHSPRFGVVTVYLPDIVALGLGDELVRITTPAVDIDPI